MAIPTIPVYTGGVANPDGSQDQQEFTTNMFNQLSYEAALAPSLNDTVNEMNTVAGQVDTNAAIAQNSADAAQSAANFEGEFVVGVTSAEKGKSYLYDGEVWLCLQNTTTAPSQGASEWKLSVGEQYVTTAQGDVLGGKLFKGSNGETLENGDIVEPEVTHLRVLVGGKTLLIRSWDELPLPVTILSIPASGNSFNGYDIVTDKGVFEFVTDSVYNLRGKGQLPTLTREINIAGWGAIENQDAAQALQAAIDFAPEGATIVGSQGAWYYITPYQGGGNVGVYLTKSVTLSLKLKRSPDQAMTDWRSLVVVKSGANIDTLKFEGFSFDGNNANTNNEDGSYLFEHAASFRFEANATVKNLYIKDVDLYDAVADHFYFNTIIDYIEIDGVREHTRTATRAAMQFSAIPNKSNQTNMKLISYEWESVIYNDTIETKHNISNLISERIDIIANQAVKKKTKINLSNVVSNVQAFLRGGSFKLVNCELAGLADFRYCDINAMNSVFHSITNEPIRIYADISDDCMKFNSCDFESKGTSNHCIEAIPGGDVLDVFEFIGCNTNKPNSFRRMTNLEIKDCHAADPNALGYGFNLFEEVGYPMTAKVSGNTTDATHVYQIKGNPTVLMSGVYNEQSLGKPANSGAYAADIRCSATVFVDSDPSARLRGFHGQMAISITDPLQRWVYSSVTQQGFDNHWTLLTTP